VVSEVLRGFMSEPLEIALVAAVLVAIIGLSLGVHICTNARRMRARLERSKRQYAARMRRLSLGPAEMELLETLNGFLLEGHTRKHLLLTSASVFDFCASRALKTTEIEEGALAALRLKLGFKPTDGERRIRSTTLLPGGIYLLVVQRETKKFYTKIVGSDPDGLLLHIEDRAIVAPGVGTDVRCYFKSKSGTFHFDSRVLVLENARTIRLAHSEMVQRMQRRKYYRTATDLDGLIRLAGSEEEPAPTRIVDLSGGGAALTNPERRYRNSEDVQITFHTSKGGEYSIVGEVRRVSEDGDLLHVVFGPLAESTRDSLISFVLSQRNGELQ